MAVRERSDDEKTEGIKHLAYEVVMLRPTKTRLSEQANQLDWNTFIESLLTHARLLYHFFSSSDKGNDFVAKQFVKDFHRGDLDGVNHLKERIDAQVQHLSTKRIEEKTKKYVWTRSAGSPRGLNQGLRGSWALSMIT